MFVVLVAEKIHITLHYITTSTVPYSTKELILQAARDVIPIPEEDQKQFGLSPWRTCMR
jgi:hypothetical protein